MGLSDGKAWEDEMLPPGTKFYDNIPEIKEGDKVKITWNERYYGNQETGIASIKDGVLIVTFAPHEVPVKSLRSNENIERIEVI